MSQALYLLSYSADVTAPGLEPGRAEPKRFLVVPNTNYGMLSDFYFLIKFC